MATTLSVGLVQSLPPAPPPFEIRTQHSKFFLNTGLTSPICEHEPPTEMSSKGFGALPREKLCRVLMNKEHNSEFNFTKTAESGWLTSSGP